jgi:hypothetical protein
MPEGTVNWDVYSKLLLKECPQDFVSYCVPGARFVSMRETQFQTRAKSAYKPREMRGDTLIEAELYDQHFLIHVEWQSDRDEEMDIRLLGYCYEATRLHKLPVLSMVIYLQAVSGVPKGPLDQRIPTGRRLLWFDFDSLEIREQPVEEFRRLDLDAFSMLTPLCKDGARYEVLDEVLERLEQRNRKELVSIARFFAGKVFTSSTDRKRLGRRFAMLRDFLKDSWTFQETLAEGREQGLEQGRMEEARQNIERFVETRFPTLFSWVKVRIEQITDLETLREMRSVLYRANTIEEAKLAFPAS